MFDEHYRQLLVAIAIITQDMVQQITDFLKHLTTHLAAQF